MSCMCQLSPGSQPAVPRRDRPCPCAHVRRLRTPLRPLHGQLQDMHPCVLSLLPSPPPLPKQIHTITNPPTYPASQTVHITVGRGSSLSPQARFGRCGVRPYLHACMHACGIPRSAPCQNAPVVLQDGAHGLVDWHHAVAATHYHHGLASRWLDRDSPAGRLQSATTTTTGTATRSTAGATTPHPPPSPKVSQATPPAAWHLSGLA